MHSTSYHYYHTVSNLVENQGLLIKVQNPWYSALYPDPGSFTAFSAAFSWCHIAVLPQ